MKLPQNFTDLLLEVQFVRGANFSDYKNRWIVQGLAERSENDATFKKYKSKKWAYKCLEKLYKLQEATQN